MRLKVLVTVGMGRFPFDRLVRAVGDLCEEHDVFVQRGVSTIEPQCEYVDFLPPGELMKRMRYADVVVSHAGNSVRLIQNMGKIPVAIAREHARGEMSDDHQVHFLRAEAAAGLVVAVNGDLSDLNAVVGRHPSLEARLQRVPEDRRGVTDEQRADDLRYAFRQALLGRRISDFDQETTQRWVYAFDELSRLRGPHLDVGIGTGEFLTRFATASERFCVGVDAHAGLLNEAQPTPNVSLVRVGHAASLPFADQSFASASLLDTLEHVPSEAPLLREVFRVLEPGGLVAVTVPARHVFSFLDPGNAKLRYPRVHRAVYQTRFGRAAYHSRFEDLSDGFRGDMSIERSEHKNYEAHEMLSFLEGAGFEPVARDGANLFWQFFDLPRHLAPPRFKRWFDGPLRLDGSLFHRANLFLTARRPA